MTASIQHPEFRFFFFTPKYNETVAFYRDVLKLGVHRSWDRSDHERGTVFVSPNGAGFIEVEKGDELPRIFGGFYIEVDDVNGWYERVKAAGGAGSKWTSASLGTVISTSRFSIPAGLKWGFSNQLHRLRWSRGKKKSMKAVI